MQMLNRWVGLVPSVAAPETSRGSMMQEVAHENQKGMCFIFDFAFKSIQDTKIS